MATLRGLASVGLGNAAGVAIGATPTGVDATAAGVAIGAAMALPAWSPGATAGVPQEGQKRASAGNGVPQPAQARSSRVPHWAQKR
jgi:hypothetical protein